MKFVLVFLVFCLSFADEYGEALKLYKNDKEMSYIKFNSSCKSGNFESCAFVGAMNYDGVGIAKNIQKAKEMFEKSCDNNISLACYFLGQMHINGTLSPKNYNKAYKYFQISCENEIAGACYDLSVRFNIANDKKENFRQKACELGYQIDCMTKEK